MSVTPPGDSVWFSVDPQWEEAYSVLGESTIRAEQLL